MIARHRVTKVDTKMWIKDRNNLYLYNDNSFIACVDREESGFVGWNIYSMTRFYLETLSIDTEYDPTMDSPHHSALPRYICMTAKTSLVSKLLLILLLKVHFLQF